MDPGADRDAARQPAGGGQAQVGDAAIAGELVRVALERAAQLRGVAQLHVPRLVEIGREPRRHRQAGCDPPRDVQQREACAAEARGGPAHIGLAVRGALHGGRRERRQIGEWSLGERRQRIERRERATGRAGTHRLVSPRRAEAAHPELGVLGGRGPPLRSLGRADDSHQPGDPAHHRAPNGNRRTNVTSSFGRSNAAAIDG